PNQRLPRVQAVRGKLAGRVYQSFRPERAKLLLADRTLRDRRSCQRHRFVGPRKRLRVCRTVRPRPDYSRSHCEKHLNRKTVMKQFIHPDRVWIGIAVGLAIPFVGLALLISLYEWLESLGIVSDAGLSNQFRLRTLSIIALAANLIPFTMYNKRFYVHIVRHIIYPTDFYLLLWIWYFNEQLF